MTKRRWMVVALIGVAGSIGAVPTPADAATAQVGPAGGLVWGRSAVHDPNGYAYVFDDREDAAGNSYLTGQTGFAGDVSLGADAGFVVDGTGYYQQFVASFDATRHKRWIIDAVGSASGGLRAAQVDPINGLALAGYVQGSNSLDLVGPSNTVTVKSKGDWDGLVAAADTDGHLRWVQPVSGSAYEYTAGVGFTTGGGVVAGGGHEYDVATIGSGPSAVALPNAPSTREAWLAWFASDGSVSHAQATTTSGSYTEMDGFASAPDGSVAVLDSVYGTVHLAPGQASDQTFTSPPGSTGTVLASYDATGALLWTLPLTSATSAVFGSNIARDPSDGSFVAMVTFQGTLTIGTGPSAVTRTAPTPNTYASAIVRVAADGTLQWATVLGSTGGVLARAATVTPNGVAVTGTYAGTVQANPAIGGLPIAPRGMFVAGLTATGGLRWFRVGAGDVNSSASIALSPRGTLLVGGQVQINDLAVGDGRLAAGGILTEWYDDSAPVFATVSGTVTAPGGGPAAGVEVTLFNGWPAWLPYQSTTTAGDGSYAFASVPPGTYRVRFRDPQGRYARTWWQASDAYKRGTDLLVPSTGGVQADQQLAAANTGRVRGRITRKGVAVDGAQVSVAVGGAFVVGGRTGTNGFYDIHDLADGTYAVHVLVTFNIQRFAYDTTVTISGGTTVVVDHDFP